MTLDLSQDGDSVAGKIAVGETAGNVTGTIAVDGTLSLAGIYDPADALGWIASPLKDWQTRIGADGSMSGTFTMGWPDSNELSVRVDQLRH
jgi:hypothetical protein